MSAGPSIVLGASRGGAAIVLETDELGRLVLRTTAPGLPALEAVLTESVETRLFEALRARAALPTMTLRLITEAWPAFVAPEDAEALAAIRARAEARRDEPATCRR